MEWRKNRSDTQSVLSSCHKVLKLGPNDNGFSANPR